MKCSDCNSYPCEKVGTACATAIRNDGRDRVLYELIAEYTKKREDYRPTNSGEIAGMKFEILAGVVSRLKELRSKKDEP